jgi:hypothetical protein
VETTDLDALEFRVAVGHGSQKRLRCHGSGVNKDPVAAFDLLDCFSRCDVLGNFVATVGSGKITGERSCWLENALMLIHL